MQTLLVATGGGHLEELWQLRSRLGLGADVTWVTTDTPHSRSLLAGEQRLFAPVAEPREIAATVAITRFARHVLQLGDWGSVVSTGSLMAVPFLALARLHGIQGHFVESCTRVSGPSLSARLIERIPGVRCYSPYPWWHRRGWVYRGSVLDGFEPAAADPAPMQRVVVTVGTSGYGFRELIARVSGALPPGCEVLWQTGSTDVHDMAIDAQPFLAEKDLTAAMGAADLVISHSGVGSSLTAMRAGRAPLLVPRSAARGEHVDDHQSQVAAELTRRGLATSYDLDSTELTLGQAIHAAAGRRVVTAGRPSPFRLGQAVPTLMAQAA